jgi:hypothetical protein
MSRSFSGYFKNLVEAVVDRSEAQTWVDAVKENLRYLFTIRNSVNGNELFPIGSRCINKFQRRELDDIANILEQRFRLLHAIENKRYIALSTDFFFRKLLLFLFDEGVFFPNEFNHYNPEADYRFMVEMFNKRDKTSITAGQRRKINSIIAFQIKPYLEKELAGKMRT